MPKVNCNYTNCFYNDAVCGDVIGKCVNDEIELRVWYEGENETEHHECKSYKFEDKGDAYRRGEKQ